MTAATKDRDTQELGARQRSGPMAAGVKIFAGTMICIDASGNYTKGATSTTLKCVGVAPSSFDNSAGAAGGATATAKRGVFGPFANSASTDQIARKDVGLDCYMVDDQTVALTNGTNTRSKAGVIYDVDASGVWVEFR